MWENITTHEKKRGVLYLLKWREPQRASTSWPVLVPHGLDRNHQGLHDACRHGLHRQKRWTPRLSQFWRAGLSTVTCTPPGVDDSSHHHESTTKISARREHLVEIEKSGDGTKDRL